MTAPAVAGGREAERVTLAYQAALSQIGVATAVEAIELWQHVPPTQRAVTAGRWLNQAVALIMGRRLQSVTLARAYYRLTRALLTGTTVADPFRPEPANVTLDMLRSEFEELAGVTAPEPPQTPGAGKGSQKPDKGASGGAGGHENDGGSPGSTLIRVEQLDGLREQEIADEQAAERELRTVLMALGPSNLEQLTDKVLRDAANDKDMTVQQVDALRQAAHDQAGARQAAGAARVAMNGGRATTWSHQERDKRALGWVRISTTGTPCGWCAMLISRGPVYRSQASATQEGGGKRGSFEDGDKFHDNCHCIAVPVFTRDWFDGSPLFDQNRSFAELWPQATQGLGGKSALTAWRRFIRQEAAAKGRAATG